MINRIFPKKNERSEPERHPEKRHKDRKIETWRRRNPDPADMVEPVQERPQNTDNGGSSERAKRRRERKVQRKCEEQELQRKESENKEAERRKQAEAERECKKQERKERDQKFNDLMASYNIAHGGTTARFSVIRQAVENLGFRTYSYWRRSSNLERAPWRREMVLRVNKLVAVAERQQSYGLRCIETTWRIMEQDLFKNFRYDSKCNACHKRLWQPDILPEPIRLHNRNGSATPKADCYCKPESVRVRMSCRIHDDAKSAEYFLGEDTEFHDTYQSNHDRRFCLFPSNSLENYRQQLSSMTSSQGKVQRLLSELEKSQHSLFPFLVCVVDLSGDGDIYRILRSRVAFALHAAMLSQYCLLQAADPAEEFFQPLAWCITYEGIANSKCVLFMASLRTVVDSARKDPDRPPITIRRLWQGKLTNEDNALQLLLLLDYIAEWAKAVYSKCVVQCLRLLVARADPEKEDTATIFHTGITPSSSSVNTLPETGHGSDTGNIQDEREAVDPDLDDDSEEEEDDDESSRSEDSLVAELINDKEKTYHPNKLFRNRT